MGCVVGEGLGARLCNCGVEETRAKHDAAAIQADTSRQAAADRERSRPVREATREGPCLVPSLGLLPYLLCRKSAMANARHACLINSDAYFTTKIRVCVLNLKP